MIGKKRFKVKSDLHKILAGELTCGSCLEHNPCQPDHQLDTVLSSIEALPEVAEVASAHCEIYLDGGIRRGTDVLKALALGARAVLLGRPILWGLAVHGAEGVSNVLELLRTELELAMVLSGRPTLDSIDRSLIRMM